MFKQHLIRDIIRPGRKSGGASRTQSSTQAKPTTPIDFPEIQAQPERATLPSPLKLDRIDVHCHVLFGIDDGCPGIEDSIAQLRRYHQLGFKDIICTPHYIAGTNYNANNATKRNLIQQLRNELLKERIPLRLHLGNEIYIDPELCDFISSGKASAINNRFVLFELPLNNEVNYLDKIAARIIEAGYKPILAHPERYRCFKDHPERLRELPEMGLSLQSNYGSILGVYGPEAQATVKYIFEHNLCSLLGTDAHRADAAPLRRFHEAEQAIIDLIGEPAYAAIINNAKHLIS